MVPLIAPARSRHASQPDSTITHREPHRCRVTVTAGALTSRLAPRTQRSIPFSRHVFKLIAWHPANSPITYLSTDTDHSSHGPAVNMLRTLGSPRRLCDGITRRDWLHIGGCGVAGLTLEQLLARQSLARTAPAAGPSFGKAKNCIVLFLYGSPSQLETFDMQAGGSGRNPRRRCSRSPPRCRGSTSATLLPQTGAR